MTGSLQLTALYALPLTLLFVTLGSRVAMTRIRKKIGVGFNDDKELMQIAGAHNNAAENIPLALLLLAMLELQDGPAMLIHGCGIILVIARFAHAYGVSRIAGLSPGRRYGIIATWFLMLFMAGANAYLAL